MVIVKSNQQNVVSAYDVLENSGYDATKLVELSRHFAHYVFQYLSVPTGKSNSPGQCAVSDAQYILHCFCLQVTAAASLANLSR